MKLQIVYHSPKVVDNIATGAAAKEYRKANRVKGIEVSGFMEILASDITRLEQGKGKWTPAILAEYVAAVDAISKTPLE